MSIKNKLVSGLTGFAIALISMGSLAQSLPSGTYDDYDIEKYDSILRDRQNALERANRDYQQSESNLAATVNREAQIRNDLQQNRRNFEVLRQREAEITQAIQGGIQRQAELKTSMDNTARQIEQLNLGVTEANASVQRLQGLADALKPDADAKKAALDSANATLNTARSEAQAAETALNSQNTAVETAKRQSDAAKAQDDAAVAAVTAQTAVVTQAQAALAAAADADKPAAQATLDAESAKLVTLGNRRTETQAAAQAAQSRLDTELAKLPNLMTRRTNAQNALQAAQTQVTQRTQENSTAQSRLQAAQTEVDQAKRRADQANQSLTAKRQELTQLQQQNQQNDQRLQQLAQNQRENQGQIQATSQRLREIERALQFAQDDTRNRAQERDQFLARYQQALQERDFYSIRLGDVQRNTETARISIQTLAGQHGAADGDREGREIGQAQGARDGQARGSSDGKSKGTSDGQAREFADGRAKGEAQARSDAQAKGQADGIAVGQRDGTDAGTRAGLQKAYNDGKAAGLDHGDKTGSDTVAYQKGRARGEANGLAQAIKDAAPQDGLGYQAKEAEYLNAVLKKVDLGQENVVSTARGVQGRFSEAGDDRYYKPRPGSYPHPRLTAFYQVAYDSSYRDTLQRTFSEVYDRNYNSSYQASYQVEYQKAFAIDYDSSRQAGYKAGYDATYSRVYSATYESFYRSTRQAAYDAAFAANKDDKGQKDQGFKDGNAEASERKGDREGYKASYDTNLPIEKAKAFKAGSDRADALYKNNAIIKPVLIRLVDSDRDGILRPGESVQAIYMVRNFGMVSKKNLLSDLTIIDGPADNQENRTQLAELPGQSEGSILAKVQVVTRAQAEEGSTLNVRARLIDGTTEIARETFARQIQLPTGTSLSGFDGTLIPGVDSKLNVVVVNRSQSQQNLTLELTTDLSKIQVKNATINVTGLNPKESRTVTFEVVGKLDAQFEEADLGIAVLQKGLTFGRLATQTTIIARHKATADSEGLLISGNLARGAGKAMYRLSKLDTWDLRVDGQLSAGVLNNFKNKIVHVMGDARSSLDAVTAGSLVGFAQAGGQVVVWGAELSESAILNSLSAAGVVVDRTQAINGTVSGIEHLNGVVLDARIASGVRSSSVKTRAVLRAANGATVGTTAMLNGYDSVVGRIYVLGLDPADLSNAELSAIILGIRTTAQSFEQMLAAGFSNAAALPTLIRELQDEILMAESDTSVDFYSTTSSSNKINKTLVKFIKETGRNANERTQLGRFYPQMVDLVSTLKRNQRSVMGAINRSVGAFYPSWKDTYCSQRNIDRKYCPADSNNGNQ